MGGIARGLASLFTVGALLLAACGTPSVPSPPPGQSPPPAGKTPEVGVAYRIAVYNCDTPVRLGATWWSFDEPHAWPPQKPAVMMQEPYPVPGVITLKSANTAAFRADIDGSMLTLTRVTWKPRPRPPACG